MPNVGDEKIPSFEDVQSVFSRIRNSGGLWDHEHPLRQWVLIAEWLRNVAGGMPRLAAYAEKGEAPPLGYIDEEIDTIEYALERLREERKRAHGDAPCSTGKPKSLVMIQAMQAARGART